MFLNPSTSAPCAKLTLNISAFNGNTTNVKVGRPSPKSFATPVQPATSPISRSSLYWNTSTVNPGLIRPM